MTDHELADKDMQRRNVRLGLILGALVVVIIFVAIMNFYVHGLPKDANRMRERFQKHTAAEAQNLSEALQDTESSQTHPPESEEAE